jgi:peptidoglycan/xylan/chitin deacetylase (PgdA/CDA1 family)
MIAPPLIFKKIFSNQLICDIPGSDKTIYLTFDDGPTPEISDFVIETLNRYNAQATFFCLGKNIEKNQDVFQRLLTNNHKIGNHTYNHLNGWKTNNALYYENIDKFNKIYQTDIFRPPYGRIKLSQLRYLKKIYRIYLWSVISYDFDENISPDICLANVIKNTKTGSVIVFHDSFKAKKNLVYTLPRVLDYFSEKHYTFAKI